MKRCLRRGSWPCAGWGCHLHRYHLLPHHIKTPNYLGDQSRHLPKNRQSESICEMLPSVTFEISRALVRHVYFIFNLVLKSSSTKRTNLVFFGRKCLLRKCEKVIRMWKSWKWNSDVPCLWASGAVIRNLSQMMVTWWFDSWTPLENVGSPMVILFWPFWLFLRFRLAPFTSSPTPSFPSAVWDSNRGKYAHIHKNTKSNQPNLFMHSKNRKLVVYPELLKEFKRGLNLSALNNRRHFFFIIKKLKTFHTKITVFSSGSCF